MPNNDAHPNAVNQSLAVSKTDQYKTIKELFSKSRPNSSYYIMLLLSVLIIAPGLLINNTAIVIGGMLVTPILTPLLLLGLGIAVGEVRIISDVASLMLKSFSLILGVSFVMALLFGTHPTDVFAFNSNTQTVFAYFIVAIASGVAGALAFARKELSDVLPGIAIAVSLVPPLSLMGIWLSIFNMNLVRFYFIVFFLNLIGIVLGSLVVFALLKFNKSEKEIEKETKRTESANAMEKS